MAHLRRRSPRARLALILAASLSLVIGYYLGQAWQRAPLRGLSAVVYADGHAVSYPASFGIATDEGAGDWRLIAMIDTRAAACGELLRHLALLRNRLAGWPRIQPRLRPTLVALDAPDATTIEGFAPGQDWIDVVTAEPGQLGAFAADLGIAPDRTGVCSPVQTNAVLASPDGRRWALIPHEQAAIMARNIATIIRFVE